MSPAYVINALVTDQGVNMGDHGQDVVRAVAVDPTETVESLLARTLYDHDWQGELSGVKADSYLTIRLAAATLDAAAAVFVPSGTVLTTPEPLIESAARAIYAADQQDGDEQCWDTDTDAIRDTYVKLAKAAAEALGVTL